MIPCQLAGRVDFSRLLYLARTVTVSAHHERRQHWPGRGRMMNMHRDTVHKKKRLRATATVALRPAGSGLTITLGRSRTRSTTPRADCALREASIGATAPSVEFEFEFETVELFYASIS